MPQKIRELKIDEEIKQVMMNLLLTYDSDLEDELGDGLYPLQEESSSSEDIESSSEEAGVCACKNKINTITSEKNLILDLITKIENLKFKENIKRFINRLGKTHEQRS